MLQTVGNLFELFGGLLARQNDRDNRARLLRRCFGNSRLYCRGCVPFDGRLRIAHNAVFLRHIAPLKVFLPCVAAFHKIAVFRKAAFFLRGGVSSKGDRVNAVFPFSGHLHHAGFVKVIIAQFAGCVYFGDMHEKVLVIGKVNELPDILKTVLSLRGCVQRGNPGSVKGFQSCRKEIQLVHLCRAYHVIRQGNVSVLPVRVAVNEKVLRVVCGNADALHGFVKLLFGGGHGKPVAARFSRFKTGAAVNQDCKLFRFLSRFGSRCSGGNVGGGLLDFLALYGVAR